MNKISIKNIKLKAFCSFVKPTETGELPDHGLVGIKGLSGAGKTSLHLGIAYPLGYSPFPATELQSWDWLTPEKMQTELELSTPQGKVILRRGEETSLQIEGKDLIKGASSVNNELKSLLKIKIDLIEALTLREQRKPGRFLSMSDSHKKEFLSQLLELDEIEEQIATYNKKANESLVEAEKLTVVVDTLKSQLVKPTIPDAVDCSKWIEEISVKTQKYKECEAQLQEVRSYLEAQKALKDPQIEELQKQLSQKMSEIPPDFKQVAEDLQQADLKLSRLNKEIEDEQSAMSDEKRVLVNKIAKFKEMADKLSGYSAKLQDLQKQLNGIRSNVCPTCDQAWSDNLKEGDLLEKIRSMEALVAVSMEAEMSLAPTRASYEDLTWKASNYRLDEKAAINLEIQSLKQKVAGQQKERENKDNEVKLWFLNESHKVTEYYKEINKDKIELMKTLERDNPALSLEVLRTRILVEGIEKSNKETAARYQKDLDKYSGLQMDITYQQRIKNDLMVNYAKESDYAELLKSFLGTIVEEVLYEISTETNEMIKHLPNVATTTIDFVTERVTQKGTSKQEIRAIANRDGHQIPFNRLSGGQQSAVELAVDLAVGTVIGRRTGVMLGWSVIDEGCDGLDKETKEACLEVLKVASKDRLIFLIEHASEVKEYFDRWIEIEYDGSSSTIRA